MKFQMDINGRLHLIMEVDEIKMLNNLINNGEQQKIAFPEEAIIKNPLHSFKGKTREAILELVKKYGCKPFVSKDTDFVRKKYWIPDLYKALITLEERGLMVIKKETPRNWNYQFTEKLCRHFGN
jgi:hypothetical protein